MKKKCRIVVFLIRLVGFLVMPAKNVSAAANMNKKSISIDVKKTYALKVSGTKQKIKWSSSNRKIATVSPKGVVKGINPGKCTVTAKYGKKKLTCKVTVKKAPLFSVSSSNYTLKSSAKKSIKITYRGSNTIYWHNYNTDIVSCKWKRGWDGNVATLIVTPKQNGTAKIKVYDKKKKKSVIIHITVNVPKLKNDLVTKFGNEIKRIGLKAEGRYGFIDSINQYTDLIVQYDESMGTICFSLMYTHGAKSMLQEMTIYRNSNKCHIAIYLLNGSDVMGYEKTTTRSQIRQYGSLSFNYNDSTTKKVVSLWGRSKPTSSEQNSVNRLYRSFLDFCDNAIPGNYNGHRISITMKNLFPNF